MAGGASGAAAAKAQGAWLRGACAGALPSCGWAASTEQMVKGAAPAAGIQPSGNRARSTIALSARLTASERANDSFIPWQVLRAPAFAVKAALGTDCRDGKFRLPRLRRRA